MYINGQKVLENIKVTGQGPTPSGKKDIASLIEYDVTNYATAQVNDRDIVAGNIKKDVNILGVIGTYEGEIEGVSITSYNGLEIDNGIGDYSSISIDSKSTEPDILLYGTSYIESEPNSTIYLSILGNATISNDNDGVITSENLTPENIKRGVNILGVTGTNDNLKALLDCTHSCYNMFYNSNVTDTEITNFIYYDLTSNVTNMTQMFYGCRSLTAIPLMDTSNVTTMNNMFCNSSIKTIPLLDTSNVTNMAYMFSSSSIKSIPALDASNVTNMNGIFMGCSYLKTILMYGIKAPLNISSSTQFEESDLVTILNNLATVTSATTLTMGSTNLAKLTDTEKAIATQKGWTLA